MRHTPNPLAGNPHYVEAAKQLGFVHDWMESEGDTDATRLAQAIEANTLATLGLAFEQRTQTLVNLCMDAQRQMVEFPELYNTRERREALERRQAEVRARLGLENDGE